MAEQGRTLGLDGLLDGHLDDSCAVGSPGQDAKTLQLHEQAQDCIGCTQNMTSDWLCREVHR